MDIIQWTKNKLLASLPKQIFYAGDPKVVVIWKESKINPQMKFKRKNIPFIVILTMAITDNEATVIASLKNQIKEKRELGLLNRRHI